MTGQENRALAGKGRAKQKSGEWRKRKGWMGWMGWMGGGAQNKRRKARDKENSRAEKLCFLLIQRQSDGGRSLPRSRPQTVKCNCGTQEPNRFTLACFPVVGERNHRWFYPASLSRRHAAKHQKTTRLSAAGVSKSESVAQNARWISPRFLEKSADSDQRAHPGFPRFKPSEKY